MAPPRGRKKKPMRIDAALDAMRPMGFPDKVVRKCVTKLLKVYGKGSEGWYLIEEASYKLLIETLIDGDVESDPLPATTGGNGEGSSRGESSSLLTEINVNCEAEENASQDCSVLAPLEPPHFEPLPTKKARKPSYVWISDDSDDDDDDDDKKSPFKP